MSQLHDIKHRVEEKLTNLIALYQAEQQRNASLEQENQQLQEQIKICQNQISALAENTKNRIFAPRTGQSEEKEHFQKQIDNLIAEIDLCLKHLQEE